MPFNQGPLDFLKKCHPKPPIQGAVGRSPKSYLLRLPGGTVYTTQLTGLGYGPLNIPKTRDQVRQICTDPRVDVLAAYAVAMAWGGQRFGFFDASAASSQLPNLLLYLRNSQNRRSVDYDYAARICSSIPGLGISFFTKLLFFFRPEGGAYILDQWTGKSITLLSTRIPIRLNDAGLPDATTTGLEYAQFCTELDDLASALWGPGHTGEQAEAAIFDKGYGKGLWRNYVKAHFESGAIAEAIIRRRGVCLTDGNDWDLGLLIVKEAKCILIYWTKPTDDPAILNGVLAVLSSLVKTHGRPVTLILRTDSKGIVLPQWFIDACRQLGVIIIFEDGEEGKGNVPQPNPHPPIDPSMDSLR